MSQFQVFALAFCVSLANVLLNWQARVSAKHAADLLGLFVQSTFLKAFVAGLSSLFFLSAFYYFGRNQGIGLANGMALMGVTSIVAGVCFGVVMMEDKLHWSEWMLCAVAVFSIAIRYSVASGWIR